MTREDELIEIIGKANELIETQDRLINHQEGCIKQLKITVEKLEEIKKHQDDIIELLKLRIKELEK